MEKRLEHVEKVAAFVNAVKYPESTIGDIQEKERGVEGLKLKYTLALKRTIVAKHLRKCIADLKEGDLHAGVDALARSVLPFGTKGGGALAGDAAASQARTSASDGIASEDVAGAHECFSVQCPRVCDLDLSAANKLVLFTKIVAHDLLKVLIADGENLSVQTSVLCGSLVSTLEELVLNLEDVPESVEEVLCICRALKSLLNYNEFDLAYDDVHRLSGASQGDKTNLLSDVAAMIQRNSWYAELLKDFIAAIPNSRRYCPKLASCLSSLNSMAADSDFIQKMTDAVALIGEARNVLRVGTTQRIGDVCRGVILRLGQSLISGTASDEVQVQLDSDFIGLVEKVCEVWPGTTEMDELLNDCKSRSLKQVQQTSLDKLFSAISSATSSPRTGNWTSQVADVATRCGNMTVIDEGGRKTMLDFIMDAAATVWSDMSGHPDIWAALKCVMDVLPEGDDKGCASAVLTLLKHGLAVRHQLTTYRGLGGDETARAEADPDRRAIANLMRYAATFRAAVKEGVEADGVVQEAWHAEELLQDAEHEIETARLVHEKAKVHDLETSIRTIEVWAGGSKNKSVWWADLADDAALDDILQHSKTGLLTHKIEDFKRAATTIDQRRKGYEDMCGFFDIQAEGALTAKAKQVSDRVLTSRAEGLLCALFNGPSQDRMTLKKKVHGIQKELTLDRWSALQPALRARANDALKLK